ncbi:Transcriptional regulator, AsnC family [Candidatus Methanomethylophilus alvi Mx1201]|jgi:DNA-binding Lrp family transcriptional regulator|uniref:Transcriptional regulator, AsnC family n=2 Tax=Methanomethylophilus alvi TaxID=1291540 RepID=M9SEP6_METAX|nr:Lrp/AsnC family transcriptional regulator [Methanomethylophilus alvi]CDF30313.1 transcription regulator Lrp/AsnC family [Methanoculleus sp. CAG:1088]AGI86169.1 Transcriptional regulator, AsnC family [Candidatus Methanomethylophilus alvi Mx1201]AYQ55541.1 transcriptional regulator [Methanomethylophilus alvi]MCI5973683.1 Lrp/AsnC family transcriptional regulator [Methanomethylophilus alvi]MDD7480152.1 Lrp/AsnC family transcriptional regulator [Methanomethylophilus alvi]
MGDLKDFDELDKRIIEMMCNSSQGSYRQLAKQMGVHPTTLIQRVKTLEAKGVIKGYRAKVDYVAMGYDYNGLVQVYTDNIESVEKELVNIPEVAAVYDVTGEADVVVYLCCLDRDEFSAAVKRINNLPGVVKTNTSVILNIVKPESDFIPKMVDGGQ